VAALHIAVLHGPNLNLLGRREPEIYGSTTLAEIDRSLVERGQKRGATVETFQSNVEGELVTRIQEVAASAQGLILNPAAYTHTSIAIYDALKAAALPCIEVHLSNLHRREPFRRRSLTAAACVGTIAGFGARSYFLALDGLLDLLEDRS
jgi:3-dehydroquinate dehydratase II